MIEYRLSEFAKSDEKIVIQKSRLYKKGQLPEHMHKDFMEILYILEGSGYHVLNGNRTEVGKGDLVFLCYASHHTLEASSNDFLWIDICFKPDFLNHEILNKYNAEDILKLNIFRDFKDLKISGVEDIVIKNGLDEFEYLVLEMLNEYSKRHRGYIQNLRYYIIVLLSKIFRFESNNKKNSFDKADDLIKIVLNELVCSKYGDINVEKAAKEACMSYKYFSRIFKTRVGMTFTEFIHIKRIEKACELLSNSEYSISDISEKVGFNDTKSFYRNFKKITGKTPNKYRQEFKK